MPSVFLSFDLVPQFLADGKNFQTHHLQFKWEKRLIQVRTWRKWHSSKKSNIQVRENGDPSESVHTLFKASLIFFHSEQPLVQIMPSKVPVFAKENYRCIFERRWRFSRSCQNIEREFEHSLHHSSTRPSCSEPRRQANHLNVRFLTWMSLAACSLDCAFSLTWICLFSHLNCK